jgi:CxxC-x17-CxxC domain-containing protein
MQADRMLQCADCGIEFVFTVAEQQFWEERAFRFPPRRCKDCRKKRRDTGDGSGGGGRTEGERASRSHDGGGHASSAPRESHPATCSSCGAETTVPFKPDPARATFCRTCYASRKKR